jgi:hypothetical protein
MSAWESVLSEAAKSFRGGNEEVSDAWGELRGEAVVRGEQLLEEAKKPAALLALAATRGVRAAREYGVPLVAPRRRRSSAWKWIVVAAAAAVIAAGIASRD